MGHRSKTRLRKSSATRPVRMKSKKTRTAIKDSVGKRLWDYRKTTKQNYAAIGLKAELESTAALAVAMPQVEVRKSEFFMEKAEEAQAAEMPAVIHASEREKKFIEECKRRYGDDFDKMSRDIKLNIYQLSPGEIRKKFLKLEKGVAVHEFLKSKKPKE